MTRGFPGRRRASEPELLCVPHDALHPDGLVRQGEGHEIFRRARRTAGGCRTVRREGNRISDSIFRFRGRRRRDSAVPAPHGAPPRSARSRRPSAGTRGARTAGRAPARVRPPIRISVKRMCPARIPSVSATSDSPGHEGAALPQGGHQFVLPPVAVLGGRKRGLDEFIHRLIVRGSLFSDDHGFLQTARGFPRAFH